MALGYLDDGKLTAIADSIRSKTGKSATMTVDEMPGEIEAIETGGGGASNVVFGSFHTPSSYRTTSTLEIPYTGSGYPIAFIIFVSDGVANETEGHTKWTNLVRRYAVGCFSAVKYETNTAPSSDTSGYYKAFTFYKNSTSDPSLFNTTTSTPQVVTASNPTASSSGFLVFYDATTIKYMTVGNSGTAYGFAINMDYTYAIIYSE